jgi:hypothetical protein
MSYNNVLKISDIKESIYKWVASLKFVSINNNIVYEEQNQKRPVGDYVSYKIMTLPTKRGTDSQIHISGDNFKLSGHRTFTVSIKSYGKNAAQIITDLHSSLEMDSVRNIFRQYNIAIWEHGSPRDISAILETGFESRAFLDITFGTRSEITETLGHIANAEVEGAFTDVDNSIIVLTDVIESV